MRSNYDIAIIGSGFAGSLMAMIGRRLGKSVALIEKGKHPRVVIGESSTPLTNLLLEELIIRYDLPRIRPLTKWGSWQQTYPHIACGLKRGFTFYHHDRSRGGLTAPERSRQLLVAASPNDTIADTHWYRADFDHFFVRQAQEIGVDYLDETTLAPPILNDGAVTLEGRQNEHTVRLTAKFLIDASGPRGFLHRAFGLSETELPNFPATQALYSHFTGVSRLDSSSFGANEEQPPYAIDDAAVHHVFDGGWIWVLRFNNGVTSAGVAAIDRVANQFNFSEGEGAWRRLLEDIPALREQFADATHSQPFRHILRLSYCSAKVTGENWAMLPSAAGFVDPLLSTGFPLTLSGITRLAEIIENDWGSSRLTLRLDQYADQTHTDLLAAARLVGSLYANMHDFPAFRALSLIYFAAVSYAEAARRLGKAHLAGSFLLRDHPVFGAAIQEILERAGRPRSRGETRRLIEDMFRRIGPFDIAGFTDKSRGNWYPVDPADLLRSASKVEATPDEISQMLKRCGIALPPYPDMDATHKGSTVVG